MSDKLAPLMPWTSWDDERPTVAGVYWWRLPARNYGGLTLRPELTAKLSMHGMGLAESELWPTWISHWNGYNRTAPAGLEWARGEGLEEKHAGARIDRLVRWVGLDPVACAYCGSELRVDWTCEESGGGCIVGAQAYSANRWCFECRQCGMTRSGWQSDLARTVERLQTVIACAVPQKGQR